MGDRVQGCMAGLAAAGIDPARVTKILVTHCPEGYESLELKRAMKLA